MNLRHWNGRFSTGKTATRWGVCLKRLREKNFALAPLAPHIAVSLWLTDRARQNHRGSGLAYMRGRSFQSVKLSFAGEPEAHRQVLRRRRRTDHQRLPAYF